MDNPQLSLRGTHVLVVDGPEDARSLANLLTAEGCDVRVAHNAPEALAILTTFPAQIIVLDLALPGMSGLLLTRTLKADPVTRDLIVLGLSSVGGLAVERVALEAGCAALVPKPISLPTFILTLAYHLKGPR
jgi:CheY-like chemotaxis protein